MHGCTVGTAFSFNPAVNRILVKHNPGLGTSCNMQLQKGLDKNRRAVKKFAAPKSHGENRREIKSGKPRNDGLIVKNLIQQFR